jgi:hypothetical protein
MDIHIYDSAMRFSLNDFISAFMFHTDDAVHHWLWKNMCRRQIVTMCSTEYSVSAFFLINFL